LFTSALSGWSYDRWQGVLYPHQLPPRQEFDRYTQHYQTVEVNSTYYRWPANERYLRVPGCSASAKDFC
jgi:uncharacterized protein YecE (DUF72 family)